MQVREIMTEDAQSIQRSETVTKAALLMRQLDIGALPVCDGRALVGMITDRDITIRVTAEDRDPTTTRVDAVMTADVNTLLEEEDVERATEKMNTHQVRRMPVLNRHGELIGMVSLGDVAVRTSIENSGEALKGISSPSYPAGRSV